MTGSSDRIHIAHVWLASCATLVHGRLQRDAVLTAVGRAVGIANGKGTDWRDTCLALLEPTHIY